MRDGTKPESLTRLRIDVATARMLHPGPKVDIKNMAFLRFAASRPNPDTGTRHGVLGARVW